MARYSEAGGGLMAGGLTYAALFALLPALVLITGILGFIVDDVDRRRAIVEGIGESLPPLRGLLDASLDQIAEGAASAGTHRSDRRSRGGRPGFYGSLDEAFARIFGGPRRRGFLAQTIRGLLSVVLLISVFLVALILTGIASFLAEQTASRFGADTRLFWAVVTPLLTLLTFVGAMVGALPLGAARRCPVAASPAAGVRVGFALTVLTMVFSYIAPRLIGAAAALRHVRGDLRGDDLAVVRVPADAARRGVGPRRGRLR